VTPSGARKTRLPPRSTTDLVRVRVRVRVRDRVRARARARKG